MAAVVRKLSESAVVDGGGGAGKQQAPTDGGGSISRSSSTRGSLRKVLPSVPDLDQQLSMSSKLIDRRTSTPKGNHAYTPHFFEYALLAEYNLMQKEKVQGVYVVPSAKSPLVWFGVIFIRHGDYQEGIFRFSVHIPENFPDGPVPKVIFESPIFHPLVSPDTSEMDVGRGFTHKWRRNVNHIFHLLLYVRRAFHKIETIKPLNPEAAVLYESDIELFRRRVRSCVAQSQASMYDSPATLDSHAIIFSPYQPVLHDAVREQLKTPRPVEINKEEGGTAAVSGLSWVKPDTMQIFSKPSTS